MFDSPYTTPKSQSSNPWIPSDAQGTMQNSPVSSLTQRMNALSLEDQYTSLTSPAIIKAAENFYLPYITDTYLLTHSIKEWQTMWKTQCEQCKAELMHPAQLKQILLHYTKVPMGQLFWQSSYIMSIDQIFSAVEKKCTWYKPSMKVMQIIPKLPNETFDEYLNRHLIEAQMRNLTYSDAALYALSTWY